MNNLTYDPWKVLQVPRDATLTQVKSAYREIARIYHPDKGGNSEMFRILTNAYKAIVRQLEPITSAQANASREPLENPRRGSNLAGGFTLDKFNQNFLQQKRNEVDFTYGVDPGHYKARNLQDYRRERESVTNELDQMKPIFTGGMGFNPTVFNQMFTQLKQKEENRRKQEGTLTKYTEPVAMVSNQISFSNLNPHANQNLSRTDISTGDLQQNFCDLNDVYSTQFNSSFHNPTDLTQEEYEKYQNAPAPQNLGTMSQSSVKQRMGEYNSQSFHQIPKGGPAPPSGDLYQQQESFDPYFAPNDPLAHQGNNRLRLTSSREQSSSSGNTEQQLPHPSLVGYSTAHQMNQVERGKPIQPNVYRRKPVGAQNFRQNRGKEHQPVMPYPSSSNQTRTQSAGGRMITEDPERIKQMEDEIMQLRRKNQVQDRLIRKINKRGLYQN